MATSQLCFSELGSWRTDQFRTPQQVVYKSDNDNNNSNNYREYFKYPL